MGNTPSSNISFYSAGIAMGSYVGIFLENRLAVGRAALRVITRMDASELIKTLREKGCGVTNVEAQGSDGNVNVIFMVIRRDDFETIAKLVKKIQSKSFLYFRRCQVC